MNNQSIEVINVRSLVLLGFLLIDVMGDEHSHVEALRVLDLFR